VRVTMPLVRLVRLTMPLVRLAGEAEDTN